MRMILILLILINLLFADHNDEKKLKEFHLPYDMSYLKLNKEQHKQMRSILSKNRKRLKHLHEAKEKLEKERKHAFEKKYFNKVQFIQHTMNLKKESTKIEADMLEAIHKILTKRQRKDFAHYLEEWEDE